MNQKSLFVLILALLASTVFFYSRNQTKEGYLFRLMDHLPEIEFVQSRYAQIPEQGGVIKVSQAAAPEKLERFISDRINHDFMKGSPVHPLKLKAVKTRMGPLSALKESRWQKDRSIGLRTENILFAPPPTVFRISKKLGSRPVLSFGYALVNDNWVNVEGTAVFRIVAEDVARKSKVTLFNRKLDVQNVRDRRWVKDRINLRQYANREVRLTFETSALEGSKALLAGWINPVLIENSAPRKKFNVILISIDTLRSDHLGCYGYKRETTPRIDQIAKKGIIFRNAIAQAPYTMSSHMSILTSLYPSFHGVNKLKESILDSKVTTLAELLYNEGYRTLGIVGGGQLNAKYGFAEGFESYIEYTHSRDVELKVAETIEFLEKEKKNNFFIFFHTFRPHTPYKAPAPYDRMFDPNYTGTVNGKISTIDDLNSGRVPLTQRDIEHLEALYDGEIRQTDDDLQPLFDYLKKTGLDENTLIVITSDHGEEFGEHGKVSLHSHTLYDELLRVPLIMVLPDVLPQGKSIQDQVRSIDIAPTILQILQIPKVEEMQGSSLIRLINTGVFGDEHKYAYSERLPTDNIYLRSARTASSKFIYEEVKDLNQERFMRFNLKEDPQEQDNIYAPSDVSTRFMNQIQFLLEKERNRKAVARRQELDQQTLETLKSLGYIN